MPLAVDFPFPAWPTRPSEKGEWAGHDTGPVRPADPFATIPGAVPWSGTVRLECSADLPSAEVIRLADLTTRLLPPLASSPHKDPRAPQNLVPIGGLERELRHRLGDQQLLYRSLRAAAATWPAPTKTRP